MRLEPDNLDQVDEEILTSTVSDEDLEAAAGLEQGVVSEIMLASSWSRRDCCW